jgi:esterase/lipase
MRVLCLHGLGGTGATMWPVVGSLGSAQHQAFAPTLPGHGGDPSDLIGLSWDDWLTAAAAWPADVVVGQSMGANLALALAAQGACRAVVAINPLAADPDAIEGLEWRMSRGHDRVDVEPSAVGEAAYRWLPMAALLAMHTGVASVDLAAVTARTLLITSAQDDVVDPSSSDRVAASLGTSPHRMTLHTSGHVATLDVERDAVCTAIVTFVATMTLTPG